MEQIRIGIVEDDEEWLTCIRIFLKNDPQFEICWTASTSEESIAQFSKVETDVVLMDIHMHGNSRAGIYNVLDFLEIKAAKIIMVTSMKEEQFIKDAFTAGAIDYVLKDEYMDLPFLIKKVHRRSFVSDVLVKEFQRLKREDQLNRLTISEKELVSHLEEGYNYNQIETVFFKSQNTIKQQMRSILKKLNVKSSKEALKKIRFGGIIKK
jgi:two-component system, NarL family, response regulator DevR